MWTRLQIAWQMIQVIIFSFQFFSFCSQIILAATPPFEVLFTIPTAQPKGSKGPASVNEIYFMLDISYYEFCSTVKDHMNELPSSVQIAYKYSMAPKSEPATNIKNPLYLFTLFNNAIPLLNKKDRYRKLFHVQLLNSFSKPDGGEPEASGKKVHHSYYTDYLFDIFLQKQRSSSKASTTVTPNEAQSEISSDDASVLLILEELLKKHECKEHLATACMKEADGTHKQILHADVSYWAQLLVRYPLYYFTCLMTRTIYSTAEFGHWRAKLCHRWVSSHRASCLRRAKALCRTKSCHLTRSSHRAKCSNGAKCSRRPWAHKSHTKYSPGFSCLSCPLSFSRFCIPPPYHIPTQHNETHMGWGRDLLVFHDDIPGNFLLVSEWLKYLAGSKWGNGMPWEGCIKLLVNAHYFHVHQLEDLDEEKIYKICKDVIKLLTVRLMYKYAVSHCQAIWAGKNPFVW